MGSHVAVAGSPTSNQSGSDAVSVTAMPSTRLVQLAAWPETLAQVRSLGLRWIGSDESASLGPGASCKGVAGNLLRVEPLKFWLLPPAGADIDLAPDDARQIIATTLATGMATLPDGVGTSLDLSGARTRVCVAGARAPELLNRFVPLDLRATVFPAGRVATTAFEHMGVTVWHREDAFHLFMPSSFAQSFIDLLTSSQQQFNI